MLEKEIKLADLNFFTEKVSEEINKSNIYNFIKTSFLKNNLKLSKDSKVFFSFLKYTNEYFIVYYKNKNKQLHEFEYFYDLLKNDKNTLVVYEDYFFLFEGQRFYYFQKISEELKKDDLKEYINKRFNFYFDNNIVLNKKEFIILKENSKINNSNLEYLHKKINLKLLSLLFIFLLSLPLFYNIFQNYNNSIAYDKKIENLEYKIKEQKQKIKKEYLHSRIANLFKTLKDKNINLIKINYKNKKVNLSIASNKRDNIYAFFKTCKKLYVKSFTYKEKEDVYETNISFVL